MNLLDESIFQVSDEINVSIDYIGNNKNKIITIDNFLRYPEKFKKFLNTIPFQNTIKEGIMPKGFYPGYQIYLNYNFEEISNALTYLIHNNYGYKPPYYNFSYQCVDGNKKVYNQSNQPHCDQRTIAGNIFLNTEEEIDGKSGTAFYRLKETGEENFFPNNCTYRKDRYQFFNPDLSLADFNPPEENDFYTMYHLSEIKFNRLNIYEGGLFHSVFIEKNKFKKFPRVSLSFLG